MFFVNVGVMIFYYELVVEVLIDEFVWVMVINVLSLICVIEVLWDLVVDEGIIGVMFLG